MEKKKEDKGNRFVYDSDLGLSIVKESEPKKEKKEDKIEKSEENNILNRIMKWL